MDLKYFKIKNGYLLVTFWISFFYCLLNRGIIGLKETILGILLIFVFLIPVFSLKGIGAADVKLFCVIACFYPPTLLFQCILAALFIAAAEGIIILALTILRTRQISFTTSTKIHFSIPIMFSVLLQLGGIY